MTGRLLQLKSAQTPSKLADDGGTKECETGPARIFRSDGQVVIDPGLIFHSFEIISGVYFLKVSTYQNILSLIRIMSPGLTFIYKSTFTSSEFGSSLCLTMANFFFARYVKPPAIATAFR